MMHDRDIRIERAKVNRSLIISSFPANYSKEDLLSVAERYGPVENVEFPSKGVALVKWSHREDCQSACLVNSLSSYLLLI